MRLATLKRLALLAIPLAVAAAAAGYGGALWLGHDFRAPGPAPSALRIQVEPGTTVRTVLGRLASVGALNHPRLTEVYLRLHGRRFSIKAGEYEVPAHASAADIVALLAAGRVVLEQLTIVEGTTFDDFRRALESDPQVRSTLRGKSDAEVMAAIGHGGEDPEGRFFPDTYRFASGTSDVELLKLAYDKMQRVLAAAWAGRLADLPLRTPYDALILASIIEKETGLAAERPLVAGVFIGRLRKGMRLQADPTVIYGMGASYDGQIRTRDLVTDTPYNTYTRTGLPPTPIALPSRGSILAAVRPQETGALYFVATGEGGHRFSATLEEHDEAVQHYLARLRAQEPPTGRHGGAPARTGSARTAGSSAPTTGSPATTDRDPPAVGR
ncbi:MAG TPA: endolytic transglycosylase MltG [Steroidobacteraceae bacterium]|nr:endolytic transglycosylase MltG [Steroidobacteraceae bacterium]